MSTNWGIKVSKPGISVASSLLKDLRFLSEDGALKIFTKGSLTLTTDGSGDGVVSFNHGLGYAPAFMAFRKAVAKNNLMSGSTEYTDAFFPIGGPNYYVKDDDLHDYIHAYADGDNLYIQCKDAQPSTDYYFVYFLLVDQSQVFSGNDNIDLPNDYGFKISHPGVNVLTGKEYEMNFSSKYKIIQYYQVNEKSQSKSFEAFFASISAQNVEQASYIDFEHGLGYPPLFIAHAKDSSGSNPNLLFKIPTVTPSIADIGSANYSISGFADDTRVRIYIDRRSSCSPPAFTVIGNWPATVITIKIKILTENLDI